jgi:hypothetical protein
MTEAFVGIDVSKDRLAMAARTVARVLAGREF